jgi:hypothetical protein
LKIPGAAEVFWDFPSGRFPYWRGSVEPTYEFVDARSSLNFSMR